MRSVDDRKAAAKQMLGFYLKKMNEECKTDTERVEFCLGIVVALMSLLEDAGIIEDITNPRCIKCSRRRADHHDRMGATDYCAAFEPGR